MIVHPTAARTQYIENVDLGGTRTAKYPSTISSVKESMSRAPSSASHGMMTPFERTGSEKSVSQFTGSVGTPSQSSGVVGSSMLSRGVDSSDNGGVGGLRGPPEHYIVRIDVEVYSSQVVSTLFEKGSSKNLLDTFVAPHANPFIPLRTIPRVGSPKASRQESQAERGGIGSRGKLNLEEREEEFRTVIDSVLCEIFRDVLNLTETREQVRELIDLLGDA